MFYQLVLRPTHLDHDSSVSLSLSLLDYTLVIRMLVRSTGFER